MKRKERRCGVSQLAVILSGAFLLTYAGCASTLQEVGLRMVVRDAKAGTPQHPFCFSGIFYAGGKGVVVEVAPSSKRFGIQPGDKIKTIDGMPWYPPPHGSLADAWKGWETSRVPGQHVSIGVEREGRPLTFNLICEDAQALYAKPLLAGADDLIAKRWDSCLYNAGNVLMATGPNEWAYFLQQQCVTGKFKEQGQTREMIPQLVSADVALYGTNIRHFRIGGEDVTMLRPAVLASIEGMRKLGYPQEATELETLLNADTIESEYRRQLASETQQRESDKQRYALEIARLQTEKEAAIAAAQRARAAAAKSEAQAARLRNRAHDSNGEDKRGVDKGAPHHKAIPKPDKEAIPELLGTATCFAVDPSGVLLTSNHVVRDADTVLVRFPGKTWLPGTVEKQDPANDLALIRIAVPLAHTLSLRASAPLHLGEPVFTIGFPVPELLGSAPKFAEGTVASTDGPGGEPTMFQMTVPIQPGNSGGPVVAVDGSVIGIVAATAKVEKFIAAFGTIPQNVNWAVKASYAAPLLIDAHEARAATDRATAITKAESAVCQVAVFRWPASAVAEVRGAETGFDK